MVILGYVVCLGYVLGLIFLIGPLVKTIFNIETSRKVIHTMLFFEWIFIDIFLKGTIHQITIPVIFVFLNTLSYKFNIYKSVERKEDNHKGTIYFAIAITILLGLAYIFPSLYTASGVAVFCLTFGDGFAALVGYNTKSKKLHLNKSLNGFIACIVSTILSILAFSMIYNIEISIVDIVLLGFITAILELVGKGLDNFTVSIGTFVFSILFINYPSQTLTISCICAIAVFLIVFFTKAIDFYGSLTSFVVVFLFNYFGSTKALIFLLIAYFSVFSISLYKKAIKKHQAKSERRNFKQILINGGLGTAFVIIYGVTGNIKFMILSIIAIGGCFVDSIASDIGVLSSKTAYDFLKHKQVPKGISGGITLLGCVAAFIASLLVAILACFIFKLRCGVAIFIFLMCSLQTSIDTALGSLIQAKYHCPSCKHIVEKRMHCSNETKLIEGVNWVDNNTVNALSSLITVIISLMFFGVL